MKELDTEDIVLYCVKCFKDISFGQGGRTVEGVVLFLEDKL